MMCGVYICALRGCSLPGPANHSAKTHHEIEASWWEHPAVGRQMEISVGGSRANSTGRALRDGKAGAIGAAGMICNVAAPVLAEGLRHNDPLRKLDQDLNVWQRRKRTACSPEQTQTCYVIFLWAVRA